jgi:hypothetical protein
VAIGVNGHVIDQINDTVFQPARIEAIHHVQHERALV